MWELVSLLGDELIDVESFWSGVSVWIDRPHILNRRVIASEVLKTFQLSSENPHITFTKLHHLASQTDSVSAFIKYVEKEFECHCIHDHSSYKHEIGMFIQLRKLLPRNSSCGDTFEISLIDRVNSTAAFLPLKNLSPTHLSPVFPYQISCSNKNIVLSHYGLGDSNDLQQNQVSLKWLSTQVLPKIHSWCKFIPNSNVIPSLCKISIQDYSRKYQALKLRHGKRLVENWPECTDPKKFVYEDIAIAAYLITLWEDEEKKLQLNQKQSFVDLGCGNGLLVHILASEGYPGIGIDVRKRNIWSFYGPETKLIEKTFVPSDSMLFPEYDWLIGNHSDELTPWIPVIAARSSYKMRVFLLPCCAFTFNGKYERAYSDLSKYQSYLDFVEKLCEIMGFNVLRDRLRIPSTKRVCFICSSRNYDYEDEERLDKQRTLFIQQHSKQVVENSVSELKDFNESHDTWSSSFNPREKIEVVRNCCGLDPAFNENMVILVMNMLLSAEEIFIDIEHDDGLRKWKRGGTLAISEIATKLECKNLQQLKNQCGGVQTLLKNHRNIFKVEKGLVSLQVSPVALEQKKGPRKPKYKKSFTQKPCIFYLYHPNGCPLSNKCKFLHESVL